MAHLPQPDCHRIATALNRRLRKRLGYRTPEECMPNDAPCCTSNLISDTNVDHLSGPDSGQHARDLGHERSKLRDSVGRCVHHDNGYHGGRDILLKHQVAVDRHQVRENGLCHGPQEVTVATAEPALLCDRGDVEPRKVVTKSGWDTLVEQHPHSGRRDPLL